MYADGGVVVPGVEFRVEEDLVVGTVPLDSVEESEVRKLAFDRRRSSLKKGMAVRDELWTAALTVAHGS